MYAPSALTSCCTAFLHALLQNPAVLILVGLLGAGAVMTVTTDTGNFPEQCRISIRSSEFAKDDEEARQLDELTRKAVSAFESLPIGSPSESLVTGVLEKLERLSGGKCLDASLVLSDQMLLRNIMKVYFLDIVSTARSLDEAIRKYKEDTRQ